ncbi:competence type IV pilus minor pilin ComGD [Heyndrickxia faecalis]|uniref:competence type IV pilus minor pilin ComGD n=1 Tax=Heyndrickxia faecalis TaxID=2824910 RepID=UPI003D1E7D07
MKRPKNEAGFTFPEMLVILLIVSVITALAFAGFKPVKHTIVKKMFINQLENDLYLAQTDAISRQTNVYVQFFRQNNMYSIFEARKNATIIKRRLPEGIKIFENGSFHSYAIGPDGNVTQFGTLYFQSGQEQIKLVTHIGSGRFYVEE